MKRNSPPQLPLRFFRWFCHPKLRDSIEGDLMELYAERMREKGKRKADLKFIGDVLLLCRPGIIRPTEGYNRLNNYGMIKSFFKIGWRNLWRNKSYALINVAGLALSMTCGILIFSLVNHHLSFDNFHQNTDRLYRIVTEKHRDVLSYDNSVPSPLGENFRKDYTLSEKIARVYTEYNVLITIEKASERVKFKEPEGMAFTEVEFFEMFNFPLLHGDQKTALQQPYTAILTEKVAQKYYGNEDPIGKIFWMDNKIAFTVTGVLKNMPDNTEIQSQIFVSYSSLKAHNNWLAHETAGWGGIQDGMKCYTLVNSGVNPTEVEEALQLYVKKFRPNSKNVHHYKLQPVTHIHFDAPYGGTMAKSKLLTLAIIGSFLILTACLNFINLATAQALRRSKEVGVRKVLGGYKYQVFWQFIFETAIIAAMGIVVAIALASIIAPTVSDLLNIQLPTNLFENGLSLFFAFGLGLVITIVAGYYPAMILSAFQPVAALKGRLSQQSIGGFNTRRTLIVTQFAISQVLIIGMLVVMNQMRYAHKADLGFEKEAIVMINAGTDSTQTKSSAIKNEISRLPGVEKVSRCFTAPASNNDWGNSIKFENSDEEVNFRTSIKAGDVDYLSTFGLELVAGKNLEPSDTVREILVNETLVRKLNLNSPEEALGRMIWANGGEMQAPIVGVVKDFHDKSFHEDISPILLTTLSEAYSSYAVKLNLAQAKGTLEKIEKIWLAQHPDQLFEYQFLDDNIAQFYEGEQMMLRSIEVFSFIAIFIGCLGLYGLISFMTAQKTKEIGIRKVLGGDVVNILWVFGKEFLALILVASLIAAPVGWWFMHNWLQGFKFQVSITAWTFVLAIGFSVIITSVTISYQAIRAAIANPVKSLRSE